MPNVDAVHLWDKRRNIMPFCEIHFFFGFFRLKIGTGQEVTGSTPCPSRPSHGICCRAVFVAKSQVAPHF